MFQVSSSAIWKIVAALICTGPAQGLNHLFRNSQARFGAALRAGQQIYFPAIDFCQLFNNRYQRAIVSNISVVVYYKQLLSDPAFFDPGL